MGKIILLISLGTFTILPLLGYVVYLFDYKILKTSFFNEIDMDYDFITNYLDTWLNGVYFIFCLLLASVPFDIIILIIYTWNK
jgi:hypothetical protein